MWKGTTQWHVSYQGYYMAVLYVLFVWEGEHTVTRNILNCDTNIMSSVWTQITSYCLFNHRLLTYTYLTLSRNCKHYSDGEHDVVAWNEVSLLLSQGAVPVPPGGPRLPQDAVWGRLQSGGEGLPGECGPISSSPQMNRRTVLFCYVTIQTCCNWNAPPPPPDDVWGCERVWSLAQEVVRPVGILHLLLDVPGRREAQGTCFFILSWGLVFYEMPYLP